MIVELPTDTPVTTPVNAFTAATPGLLLLQLPPPVAPVLVKVVDKPVHTVAAPLRLPALASAMTVTSLVAVDVPHALVTL